MKLISDTGTGSAINSNAPETENSVQRARESLFIIYEPEMIANGICSN
jgi:hypothetical protein